MLTEGKKRELALNIAQELVEDVWFVEVDNYLVGKADEWTSDEASDIKNMILSEIEVKFRD